MGASNAPLVIDPSTTRRIPRTARVLVSHAHGDHTGGFRYKGLKQSTPQTRDIDRDLREHRIGNFRALEIDNQLVVDDIRVKALDAGHMLGSAQFLIETPNTSILYTGDINCVDTLTTKAAEPQQCDILVIEATYGSPHYRFPTRETVYDEIVEWALASVRQGRIPCLHLYAPPKSHAHARLFPLYT